MDKTHILSLSLLGYNRNQVDTLFNEHKKIISDLEAQLNQITQELDETKIALAHYQEIEQALTEGIVDARVKGQEIIGKSEVQAKQLIENTNEQVTQYKEEFVYHSRELVTGGSTLKSELNVMKGKMQVIIDQYQMLLDETDFDSLFPKKQVDRLLHQVEEYEADDLGLNEGTMHFAQQEPQLSEEEKAELTRLISDVILNEAEDKGEKTALKSIKKDNLVNFTTVNRS